MSQEKKQVATIKLKVIPGSAVPGGAIAAPLGQKGVPAKMFCEKFNELTKHLKGVMVEAVSVKVLCYNDKSFDITYSTASTVSGLIKKLLNLKEIKSKTGRLTVTRLQVEEIAKKKQVDLCVKSFENAVKTIEGTLRSMAINIED